MERQLFFVSSGGQSEVRSIQNLKFTKFISQAPTRAASSSETATPRDPHPPPANAGVFAEHASLATGADQFLRQLAQQAISANAMVSLSNISSIFPSQQQSDPEAERQLRAAAIAHQNAAINSMYQQQQQQLLLAFQSTLTTQGTSDNSAHQYNPYQNLAEDLATENSQLRREIDGLRQVIRGLQKAYENVGFISLSPKCRNY